MKRGKQPAASTAAQVYQNGETVRIIRPHLWSGCVGEVVGFNNGQHRIKIEGKEGNTFHADAEGQYLEVWI